MGRWFLVGVGISAPSTASTRLSGIPKPLALTELDATAALPDPTSDQRLVIIQTGANLGYAGGNNVGIAWALRDPTCDAVWVLNNDTVIDPDALLALRRAAAARPTVGLWGVTLCNYAAPETVQAYGGGSYDRWWSGKGRLVGSGALRATPITAHDVERRIDYITGASIYATRAFIDAIGVMTDDYFLYYEEIDWASRGPGPVHHRRLSRGGGLAHGKPDHQSAQAPRSTTAKPHQRILHAPQPAVVRPAFPSPSGADLWLNYRWAAYRRRRQGRISEAEVLERVLADHRAGTTTPAESPFFSSPT